MNDEWWRSDPRNEWRSNDTSSVINIEIKYDDAINIILNDEYVSLNVGKGEV